MPAPPSFCFRDASPLGKRAAPHGTAGAGLGLTRVCSRVLILFGLFSWFFVTYENRSAHVALRSRAMSLSPNRAPSEPSVAAHRANRRILDIVYCSIGVLVFSLYIVYDTQLMIGNLGACFRFAPPRPIPNPNPPCACAYACTRPHAHLA